MRQQSTLPLGFVAPEIARVGRTQLGALIAAITQPDPLALAAMREVSASDVESFDRFVAGIRNLADANLAVAGSEMASVQSANWRVAASTLGALALAASGEMRQAIALSNQVSDMVKESGMAGAPNYAADFALLGEGVRCIQAAEAVFPVPMTPLQIESPFRYVIGYPRSGNTLLTQFLSFAFGAPNYSVYPGDGRYFSRTFYERAPGHPVFVKDHILRPEYLEEAILSPVRDGRDAMVSLARYLYSGGNNPFVRRGELADFLSYAATQTPYGFWGSHTRALLKAREHGARVRLVRYEEMFGNHRALLALARELAGRAPVPRAEEDGYIAFAARLRPWLARHVEWSEGIALPEDSFVPQNWAAGAGTIHWRSAFDAQARRRFHELGGTEMLIELGYETDGNWWRHDEREFSDQPDPISETVL
jgi:hypothetical protein